MSAQTGAPAAGSPGKVADVADTADLADDADAADDARRASGAVSDGSDRAGTVAGLSGVSSLPWSLGVLAAAVYSMVSMLRFRQVTVASWDNAIFEQAIARYSQFEAPIVAVKGPGFNILGDHFSPIYAVLAPIYRIFPHAQTLLVAQAVLLGLSVAVVARVALRYLPAQIALPIAVLYLASFGVQQAVEADFHEVAFAAPLLALAGEAWLDQRYRAVVGWTLPLLLVKEEMGATVAAVGLALLLRGQRRAGAALMALGPAAVLLTVKVLIPAFATDGAYPYSDVLGGDAGLMATAVDGLHTKIFTVLFTLGVGGFVAALSPWVLLVVPTLLWRFLGDNEFYWGTDWHYSLMLMPVVFVALIDVIRREDRRQWQWPVLAVAALVGGWQMSGAPLTTLVQPATWQATEQSVAAPRIVAQVPTGRTVESDLGLLTHLAAGRPDLYFRGNLGSVVPEYVVFDRRFSSEDVVSYAAQTYGGQWQLVADQGGFSVARRTG